MPFIRADLNKLTNEERNEYNFLSSKRMNSNQGGQILTSEENTKLDNLYTKATTGGGGVPKQSKKQSARRRRSSKRQSRKMNKRRR